MTAKIAESTVFISIKNAQTLSKLNTKTVFQ